MDDTAAAETVIEHLFSLGHKRIGVLGGEITHSNPAKSRYEGCVAAFQKHEIPFDPETQFEAAYFTMEGGYEAMGNLLDKNSRQMLFHLHLTLHLNAIPIFLINTCKK